MNGQSGGRPYESVVHETAAHLPDVLARGYAQGNQLIVDERAAYGTAQSDHLERSRRDITGTYQHALRQLPTGRASRAIVLGAGTCADIPLEGIVSEFDAVTVVDADTTQTERALSGLPAPLLGKITLLQADVSGMAPEIAAAYKRASSAPDFERFLPAAARELQEMPVPEPPLFGGDYDFTCSHLLMTQLVNMPITSLAQWVRETYQPSRDMVGKVIELSRAILDLTDLEQLRHLGQLRDMTAPSGAVHLADTFHQTGHGYDYLPMVSQKVAQAISGSFQALREPHVWQYRPAPDRVYQVVSSALTPLHRPSARE